MWSPFPTDGEWTRDAAWGESLGAAVDRQEAELGLEELRRALPPARVRAFEEPYHPLAWSYIFRASRYSLVELGTAARRFRPAQLARRLRNSSDFEGTAAELRAGLELQVLLGATLKHEPLGRGKAGPDWLATGGGCSPLLIEVKCPLSSRRSELLVRAGSQLLMDLTRELQDVLRVRPKTGVLLEFRPSRYALEQITAGGQVNKSIGSDLGAVIAGEFAALAGHLTDGTYELGASGSMSVQPGTDADGQFSLGGSFATLDLEYEFQRLCDDLCGAARQLAEHPTYPGLIVIDVHRDRGLLNFVRATTEVLAREDWARRLAGVLFLDRDFPNHVPDCRVRLAPGPRVEVLNDALSRRTLCAHGGWHVYNGVFPAPECPGWGHAGPPSFDRWDRIGL